VFDGVFDNQAALWITKNGAASWTRTKGIATFPGGAPLATFGEQGILSAAIDAKNPPPILAVRRE